MTRIDLRKRRFAGTVNYDSGDANQETVFYYDQSGDLVYGRYEGGRIRLGQIVGRIVSEDRIEFTWQYLNIDGQLVAGTCVSTPEILADGRYRLHENWKTTLGPDAGMAGESVIEEIRKQD
jgi:hypothetical protein